MQKLAWLKQRKIGGSDAAAIMGVSPWDTPYSKYIEKLTGSQKPDNQYMRWGREMEEPSRKILEKRTGMLFIPMNIESKKWEFMTASLDGYDEDNKLLTEIKNPWSEKDHLIAKAGKIPEKYFPQCQHYLECEDRSEKLRYASFFVKDKNKPISLLTEDDIDIAFVDVYRDESYIKKMVQAEAEFWDMLLTQTPPNKQQRDEPYEEPGEETRILAETLKDIAKRMNEDEAQYKIVHKKLIESAAGKHLKFPDGSLLYSSLPKGRVQYDQIPELQGINLDLYRAPPKLQWTFKSKKI